MANLIGSKRVVAISREGSCRLRPVVCSSQPVEGDAVCEVICGDGLPEEVGVDPAWSEAVGELAGVREVSIALEHPFSLFPILIPALVRFLLGASKFF